ncbi:hypothetical protein N177_3054 [Lutibaculum baratangense AMV1]|uniref:Uncharacterized protein n=1 Tax=Lutibaculum baratangense AMV1 TaxID=631454 RepID=V4R9Z7_9HYPH|nr:hypothetical protein N177_3054 [Lutibaculum baratangense AMV1]
MARRSASTRHEGERNRQGKRAGRGRNFKRLADAGQCSAALGQSDARKSLERCGRASLLCASLRRIGALSRDGRGRLRTPTRT